MIYTNDETDKAVRQKNFILTVFVLPIIIIIGICALLYIGVTSNLLLKKEANFGYCLILLLGFYYYVYQKKKWLKMPDGSYYYVKSIESIKKTTLDEPTEYEAEYFYSRKDVTNKTIIGLVLIVLSVWMFLKGMGNRVSEIAGFAGGIYLEYVGIKGLLDKEAQLKLAKKGLWTKNLGFVDWNDINKIQVIEDKSRDKPQYTLELFLKGTVFSEANQPDFRLSLTNIDGKEYVEILAESLLSKRNELPTQSSH